MSPRTKVTREEWIASTTELLDQGRVPADLTLLDLCTRMGVTKGSLYSHFSGLQDLYAEVIGRYLRDSPTNGLASSMQAIHGPLDRRRLLRARHSKRPSGTAPCGGGLSMSQPRPQRWPRWTPRSPSMSLRPSATSAFPARRRLSWLTS